MDRVIVSDTSCLIALSNIGLLNLLREVYGEILITKEVSEEFGLRLPVWIIVVEVRDKSQQIEIEKRLDRGEASSIALALEIGDATLIIDEVKGRKIAQSHRLDIIGTIGVLLLAHRKGLISDLMDVVMKLVNNGFRVSDVLIESLRRKSKKE